MSALSTEPEPRANPFLGVDWDRIRAEMDAERNERDQLRDSEAYRLASRRERSRLSRELRARQRARQG